MKQYLKTHILSVMLLIMGYMAYGQTIPPGATANQNYIATFTPRIANVTSNAILSINVTDKAKVETTIQYFDGLGRPLQTVQRQASPQGYDIVQPFAYDAYGREANKYLPYTSQTGTAGSYKADALTPGTGQAGFYTTPPGGGIPATPNPNAITVFEPSPLNRTIEQGAPGTDWQPVAGSTAGHTQKIVYTTNNIVALTDTANTYKVMLYSATINANQSRTLVQNGNYSAGQLYVTVSKDENWKSGRGGTTEEYKDKEGHVVLKRTFNYSGSTLQILSTYYVYDDLDNLAFVLPPGTNPDAVGVPAYAGSVGYQYRYDERNRLTQKKIPGKGWEFTVYNKLDQPVLTQDSLQRVNNQWVVSKYDALGRVIMTGIWAAPSAIPLSTLQTNIYGNVQWDTRDQTNNVTTYPTGYVLNSYPALTRMLTINYYDDYNIPRLPANYKMTIGVSTMTKGLLTASKTTVLNTVLNVNPDMLWDVNYYDDNGRNIRSYKQHYLGGTVDTANYDVVLNTYNFNDQLTTTYRRHFTKASTSTPLLTINNKYLYDHMGRKIKSWEQLVNGANLPDANAWTLLSQSDYNEVGQLQTKHLHATNSDSTHFKQDIAYSYNERGWLKSSSAGLFAETLNYNDAVNTSKQYNGNITNQYWGTAGNLNNRQTYFYDQLNRLTAGWATTGNNERGITYDQMGNITALIRDVNNGPIDQLSYTYTAGTNKLQSVTDATTNNAGQKSGTASYTYDGNGNLTSDNSKGITSISYNLLNLPQIISGKGTTYTYDAAGQKLSRLVGTAKTDYIGGIQYDGSTTASTISFIQTEEGRALPKDATTYNYEYTLTDHLGNSRVNFDTGTGIARQVQGDDYYPFGMEINTFANSNKNEYLYNRKELQENLGLYDYGARLYDPVVGRWTSVDPLVEAGQESTTPYGYVFENPIRLTDPDGRYPDGDDDPNMNGDFAARLVKTAIHDTFHGIFNSLNRAVGSSYRAGYKTVNGEQTFETEIYKEEAPKTLKEAGGQILSAAGDAAIFMPELGQAKGAFAKTATEATLGREAKEILAANKIAGTAGENFLNNQFGGEKQVGLNTTQGRRVVDNLTPAGKAQESKVGRTSLTKAVKKQISKDVELVNTPGNGVNSAEWNFFSGMSGLGPTKPLQNALKQAKIPFVIH